MNYNNNQLLAYADGYYDHKIDYDIKKLLNKKTIRENFRYIKLDFFEDDDYNNVQFYVPEIYRCKDLAVTLLFEHILMRKEFNKRIKSIELLYIESLFDRIISIPDVYRIILNYL